MLQLFSLLLILWAGLILGVSFIATPVKFLAKNLTMPVAMEVGRVTFHIFNKVEWVICVVAIIFTIVFTFHNRSNLLWLFTITLFLLLLIETLFLLPLLNIRADNIIRGEFSNPDTTHLLYICSEALKIILALAGAWQLLHRRRV